MNTYLATYLQPYAETVFGKWAVGLPGGGGVEDKLGQVYDGFFAFPTCC